MVNTTPNPVLELNLDFMTLVFLALDFVTLDFVTQGFMTEDREAVRIRNHAVYSLSRGVVDSPLGLE